MQEGSGFLQVTLVVNHRAHLASVLRAVTDEVEVARDGYERRTLQSIGLVAERHCGGRRGCGGVSGGVQVVMVVACVFCGFESPWVVVWVCNVFLVLFFLVLFISFIFLFSCFFLLFLISLSSCFQFSLLFSLFPWSSLGCLLSPFAFLLLFFSYLSLILLLLSFYLFLFVCFPCSQRCLSLECFGFTFSGFFFSLSFSQFSFLPFILSFPLLVFLFYALFCFACSPGLSKCLSFFFLSYLLILFTCLVAVTPLCLPSTVFGCSLDLYLRLTCFGYRFAHSSILALFHLLFLLFWFSFRCFVSFIYFL